MEDDGRSWKRQITLRLPDGFYMFKRVPSAKAAAPTNPPTPPKPALRRLPGDPVQKNPPPILPYGSQAPSHIVAGNVQTPRLNPDLQIDTPNYGVQGTDDFKSAPSRPAESRQPLPPPPEDAEDPDALAKNKGYQHPSPEPRAAHIPLSKKLERDAEKQERKRRRKEKKKKKKRKRKGAPQPAARKKRKVLTRTYYPEFEVPAFPSSRINEVHEAFAETTEASLSKEQPKLAFLKLTTMLIASHKKQCKKVYAPPFDFLCEVLLSSLDLFEGKIKDINDEHIKFTQNSGPSSHELELRNALKCVRKRRAITRTRTEEMVTLVESIKDGSRRREVEERLGPIPQPILASEEETTEQFELRARAQLEDHETFSKSCTVQLDKYTLWHGTQEPEEIRELRKRVAAQRNTYQSEVVAKVSCRNPRRYKNSRRPLHVILASYSEWALLQ